jgi:hypothetical protein
MGKSIKSNVCDVRTRIEEVARKAGRETKDVSLLAATKNRTPKQVLEAIDAGVKVFGENRVQELLEKIELVGGEVDWQFIGHLQRNKVNSVVGAVSLVHSVDTFRLAREIDRRAGQIGKNQAILLQVNIAGEESKFGAASSEVARLVDEINELKNIEIRGLSTIAPIVDNPEKVRWVFRELRELGKELEHANEDLTRSELSMGMTGDFEVAVEEGSTIVRLGTAIFDVD